MTLMDDKVAIVTGAGRGIGRGEAIELARQGAAVVVGEVDEAAAAEVVAEIRAAGGSAVVGIGDCSDVDAANALVQKAHRASSVTSTRWSTTPASCATARWSR